MLWSLIERVFLEFYILSSSDVRIIQNSWQIKRTTYAITCCDFCNSSTVYMLQFNTEMYKLEDKWHFKMIGHLINRNQQSARRN